MEGGLNVVDGERMELTGKEQPIVGGPSEPARDMVAEDIGRDAKGVEAASHLETFGLEVEPAIATSGTDNDT